MVKSIMYNSIVFPLFNIDISVMWVVKILQ